MESESGDGGSGLRSARGEIDTSAPFESVKEAVSRFGGVGYWKPSQHKLSEAEHAFEDIDISKVEEQAALLEKDLIVKERETLDVLKELESTKTLVEELKLKLQKQASEVNVTLESGGEDDVNLNPVVNEEEKDNHDNVKGSHQNFMEGLSPCPSSAPGLILMELQQAKLNLSKTTNGLADIRASVEILNKNLEKEKNSIDKTRERLTLNSSKISSLEEDLNQTNLKLKLVTDAEILTDPSSISRELHRLSSEAEQFKIMGEAARSEVLKAMSEIERTKSKIKTAEIRLIAAKKMKQAARAAEAVAIAEIKALSSHENSSGDSLQKNGVTLTFEEYSSLASKAREAEELSKNKALEAMVRVDEANVSKVEILRRVEEATEEIKTSKKALEEALNRVEAANKGKLAVEEALRKWRSDHGQRRRSLHSTTKFKNSCPSNHRKDSRLLDVNGLNLASEGPTPALKPTLSIGQILSRKLLTVEEFETGTWTERGNAKRKVSLGQMLNKQHGGGPSSRKAEKENCHKQQFSGKRKKFGFAKFSLLLAKQSKKKKPTLNLR